MRQVAIWGILNVTPDSFSDGGRFTEVEAALEHARAMVAAGADVIDVGGESTRPGAKPVTAEQELARVLPVVEALVAEGVRVSVDTIHAATARAVIAAGAEIINDVTGATHDPEMLATVAESEATLVIMHSRGIDVLQGAEYEDVVGEVEAELRERVDAALAAGIPRERLMLDPGFGFSKTREHDWELFAGLPRLHRLGLPILVGASRKRFLADAAGPDSTPTERDSATAATSLIAAQAGAAAVRVHDVASTASALGVLRCIKQHRSERNPAPVIRLEGVRARGFHGVLESERAEGQEFVVDLTLHGDFGRAATTDNLADTVNYAEVAELVTDIIQGEPFDLIETLAARIAEAVLQLDLVRRVTVTVHKPAAPIPVPFGDVTVTVSRGERPWRRGGRRE